MKTILLSITILLSVSVFSQNKAFPNHTNYVGNHIKPSNYTQTELDSQVSSFYDLWKTDYLKNDCGNANEYYVYSGDGAKNVSEAQGYGMMITAYMAGYDANAQTYFDGLYNFYKSHPSNINSNLMDWQQATCNDSPSNDDDAASDGDIDIAFALLLADAQWGSNGTINYLQEAQTIISAIMQDEINQETWTVKLGDWSDNSEPAYYYGTRSSDFIIDHFKIFACITNNTAWNNVVDTCYSIIDNMQTNYSQTSGLLPDFIINTNTNAEPAGADYLEDTYDGDYYYNACRTPWRISLDYLLTGDTRSKTAIDKINAWLYSSCSANPDNISNGYHLNGNAIYNWNDETFVAPFTVAAMLNTDNQTWLNTLYDFVLAYNYNDGDYYSHTIKLLSLLAISGNYWLPDCNTTNIVKTNTQTFKIYPNPAHNNLQLIIDNEQLGKSIKILDITGKSIKPVNASKANQYIDISNLRNGIYFIKVGNIVQKLIKE